MRVTRGAGKGYAITGQVIALLPAINAYHEYREAGVRWFKFGTQGITSTSFPDTSWLRPCHSCSNRVAGFSRGAGPYRNPSGFAATLGRYGGAFGAAAPGGGRLMPVPASGRDSPHQRSRLSRGGAAVL